MYVVLRLMEAAVEFVWLWCGLHSHFHVQPNYSVEVALCCVVVGVVTIIENVSFFDISDKSIILTFQFI